MAKTIQAMWITMGKACSLSPPKDPERLSPHEIQKISDKTAKNCQWIIPHKRGKGRGMIQSRVTNGSLAVSGLSIDNDNALPAYQISTQ